MLGFHAEALTSEITVDYGELEDARGSSAIGSWRTSTTTRSAYRGGISIARRLVEDWLHGGVTGGGGS